MQERTIIPTALPVKIADIEIITHMDAAFVGEFTISFADGTVVNMPAGSLCILPPKQYHCTCAVSENPRKLAFQFDYRKVDSDMQPVYRSFHEGLMRMNAPMRAESVDACRLMENIRVEMLERSLASDVMRQVMISEFYIYVIRLVTQNALDSTKSQMDDERYMRYRKIEGFFARRHASHTTAEELAGELGLSRRQLDRVMMEIYGMSFRERLVELRMNLAARLLVSTDLPIASIAEQVGYSSPSGFFMAFRKQYGMAAGEYRQHSAQTFKS